MHYFESPKTAPGNKRNHTEKKKEMKITRSAAHFIFHTLVKQLCVLKGLPNMKKSSDNKELYCGNIQTKLNEAKPFIRQLMNPSWDTFFFFLGGWGLVAFIIIIIIVVSYRRTAAFMWVAAQANELSGGPALATYNRISLD